MDLSAVWVRLQDQLISLIASLPTFVVALLIFAIFFAADSLPRSNGGV